MTKVDLASVSDSLSQVLSLETKNGEKQQKEMLSLSVMLDEMMHMMEPKETSSQAPSQQEAAKEGESSDGSEPPTYSAIASAIAAMSTTLAALNVQITSSNNSEEKEALSIETVQIQQAMKSLQQFQQELATIQNIVQWMKKVMPHAVDDWGAIVRTYGNEIGTKWMPALIEAINKTFGLNIPTDALAHADLSSFNKAISGLSAVIFGSSLQQAWENISGETTSNAAIAAIMKLLQTGAISSQQAMEMLSSILMQMMKSLKQMANISAEVASGQGIGNSLMASILSEMTSAVSLLKIAMEKFTSKASDSSTTLARAFMEEAQTNLQKAIQDSQNIAQQQTQQSFWSTFLKVVSIVVSVIVIVVSIATGQFLLAALAIGFLVMQESGATSKITTDIKNGLEKLGISPALAQVLADIIVVASIMAITLGAGMAIGGSAAASGAATAANDATAQGTADATANAAQQAANSTAATTAGETTEEGASASSTAAADQSASVAAKESNSFFDNAFFKTARRVCTRIVNTFKGFSTTTNAVIFAGAQTTMATNLFQDIALEIASAHHMNEKQKEKLLIALEVLGALTCIILGGLSANAIASAPSETPAFIKTLTTRLGPNFIKYAMGGTLAGTALQAGAEGKLCAIDANLAPVEASLGQDEALSTFFQTYEKMIGDQQTAIIQHSASEMKEASAVRSQVLSELFAGDAAIAQILSQAV